MSPTSSARLGQRRPSSERILEAATALFGELGFEGASTRKIGSVAGANIAMIAYHFGDKEGLYTAVLHATHDRLLAIELPSPLPGGPEQRVRGLVSAAYAFGCSHRGEVRLLMRHVIEHGSLPDSVRSEGTARLFQKVTELTEALDLPGLANKRLELMSLNHLITRYILSDLADVAMLVGEEDPEEAICRHLGDVAIQLMLDRPPSASTATDPVFSNDQRATKVFGTANPGRSGST
jgi:AcrR family transcriptional regulator